MLLIMTGARWSMKASCDESITGIDAKSGWVTMSGNQGTEYLKECMRQLIQDLEMYVGGSILAHPQPFNFEAPP